MVMAIDLLLDFCESLKCKAKGLAVKKICFFEVQNIFDALPSSLVDPLEGLTMGKCGKSWNLGPFPTSSTKGGKRGMLEILGLD